MFYPEYFKEQVREAFPEHQQIHVCLESGDKALFEYLNEIASKKISYDVILQALQSQDPQDREALKKELEAIITATELRSKWYELNSQQSSEY